jgi:hypothetical protein
MAEKYKVKSIVQKMDFGADGNFHKVFEIAYTTTGGVEATAVFDAVSFDPDRVAVDLEEAADKLDSVLKL